MTTRHYIVATAGHVDHGKSSLVRELTGTDTDRLPEEKARKITIDLGFAKLDLVGANGDQLRAGIVDVPGHEDFVRNMIAGVGSIDLALFVIAAADGWMPQSEEHLQILSYLGVRRAVITLTKSDLGKVDAITVQIRERIHGTPFENAPIIPTSIRTGDGINELQSVIAAELDGLRPQPDTGKPRLFIDRVFMLSGIGTVVTGTLTGGTFHSGQRVIVQPGGNETRIRSLQSHGHELESVGPGMRAALNLADVSVDQIERGNVVTLPALGSPNGTVVARLSRSSRKGSERPLKNGTSVYVHHGTSRVLARVTLAGNDGLARLRLASPIFAFVGDHFVIRDASERSTIGGGVVIDPEGGEFSSLPANADDVNACLRAEIARRKFVEKNDLLTKSHFSSREIAGALQRLEQQNEIVLREELCAHIRTWQQLQSSATSLIEDFHKRRPELIGVDLNELRSALKDCQEAGAFDALIADLCSAGFARRGSRIARMNHRPLLPAALESSATSIRNLLSARPFDPPARKEIERDGPSRQVLRFLIEAGEAIELGAGLVLLNENFERMKSRVVEFISRNGPATVSQLRQALESSRRIMVPLLERLDQDGVTRRVGDARQLAN